MLKPENVAKFTAYKEKELWYTVSYREEYGCRVSSDNLKSLTFPVPIEDIGTATFMAEEKALLMMRYIRKHLEMLEKAKEAQK